MLSKTYLCTVTDLKLWTVFSTVGIMSIGIIGFKKMLIWVAACAYGVGCILHSVFKRTFNRNTDSLSELLKYETKYKNCSKISNLKKKPKQDKSVILTHSILLGYYAKPSLNWVSLPCRHPFLLWTDTIVWHFIKCWLVLVYCFYFMRSNSISGKVSF